MTTRRIRYFCIGVAAIIAALALALLILWALDVLMHRAVYEAASRVPL